MATIKLSDMSDSKTDSSDEMENVKGGPHIVTLDGLGYDYQPIGEYNLIQPKIARR